MWGIYWSPDGRSLQYLLARSGATNIWEQPITGGQSRQVTSFGRGEIFDFNWSVPDKQLLFTRGSTTSDVILISNFH
jgi:Tol biopolymer transport system component